MSSNLLKVLGIAAFFATASSNGSFAADISAPESTSDWTFTVAAYGWAAGLEGQSGVFGLPPQEFDLSFSDLLENLDFAAMGLAEARNGRFVLGMDVTYTSLGTEIKPSRPLVEQAISSIDASATEWMVTGFGGYSLIDHENLRVDAIAGARLWSINSEFEFKSNLAPLDGKSFDDGETWVDPLAGVKMYVSLTPDIYVSAWGMIGGFGVGSDLMWDLMGGAGYNFTDHFSMFAGYRAVSVDYSDNGFVYDAVQKGPVVAAVVKF